MRRGRRLAAALAGTLALAGCGIRETDVVEAGGPATVAVVPVPQSRMLLFFVDADGRLMPVARERGWPLDGLGEEYELGPDVAPEYRRGGGLIAAKTLAALLAGPNEDDRAAGLSTRLSPVGKEGQITSKADKGGPGGSLRLRVDVSFALDGLDGTALRQLVCTAAYAEDIDGRASVVLSGPGGTLPEDRCDDLLVGAPSSTQPGTSPQPSGTDGTSPQPSGTDGAATTARPPGATGAPSASPTP
ncbi:hypothetical protein [Streptomyces sp. NPDC006551]|uniref:hypothetical protein n=1 Tax=Streptomyces sp. NPDC006551 TaxID=3157178 RepID=UPI0033ADBE7B